MIDIEINAEQVSIPNDAGRSIKIDVKVKNVGNRNLKLEFKKHALTVAKVRPDNEGHLLIIEWYKFSTVPYLYPDQLDLRDRVSDFHVKPLETELMRAGQTVSFPCWFRAEEAGLYLIDFEGALTGDDLEISQQETGTVRPFNVSGQTFSVVE